MTILSAGDESEQGTGHVQAKRGRVQYGSVTSASDRCISLPKMGEEK